MTDQTALNVSEPSCKEFWGPWATVGFGVLFALIYLALGIAIAIIYVLASSGTGDSTQVVHGLKTDGLFLGISSCVVTAITVPLLLLFAWLRKGASLQRYFFLNPVALRQIFLWICIAAVWGITTDLLTKLVGSTTSLEYQREIIASADSKTLLFVGIVVAAPLVEEFFFRGFLFTGLASSRLPSVAVIAITSVAWASLHIQYNLFEMAIILASGFLLGWSRIRTNSIYPALAMHAVTNGMSFVQMLFMK